MLHVICEKLHEDKHGWTKRAANSITPRAYWTARTYIRTYIHTHAHTYIHMHTYTHYCPCPLHKVIIHKTKGCVHHIQTWISFCSNVCPKPITTIGRIGQSIVQFVSRGLFPGSRGTMGWSYVAAIFSDNPIVLTLVKRGVCHRVRIQFSKINRLS